MRRTMPLLALGILLVPFALLVPVVAFGWIVWKLRHVDLEDAEQ